MKPTPVSSAGGAHGAPAWTWLLGLLPWVWIIPLNQYFWDDWIYSTPQPFSWGVRYWLLDGAKHYLDPILMPTLFRAGPWLIHLLGLAGICSASWAFMRVFQVILGSSKGITAWYAPIFLVVPVFYARFSAVTFEYSACLAAVAIAWKLVLCHSDLKNQLIAALLLVVAIGVPSLAVLFPLIALTSLELSWRRHKPLHLTLAIRHLYILLIPILYAIVYSKLFNKSGKYLISIGGVIEFIRGLIALSVLTLAFFFWRFRTKRLVSRALKVTVASMFAAYLSFFPYLAVGFNPIADFLPWRMRDIVERDLVSRMALALVASVAVAAIVGLITRSSLTKTSHLERFRILACTALLSAVVFGMGPMDWESRHWLIAWPFIASLILSSVNDLSENSQRSVLTSVFLILWVTTMLISAEYLVDSIKQRALVRAFESEVIYESTSDIDISSPILIIVNQTTSTNKLNARFRTYRSHEWWGIALAGLSTDPKRLWVLEQDDFVSLDDPNCIRQLSAIAISPEVVSSRLDALTGRGVNVSLNPYPILICPVEMRAGWPRDREP